MFGLAKLISACLGLSDKKSRLAEINAILETLRPFHDRISLELDELDNCADDADLADSISRATKIANLDAQNDLLQEIFQNLLRETQEIQNSAK